MTRGLPAALCAACALAVPASAPAADLRTDLEAVGLALDSAVTRVSRPSRAPRGVARGYRLRGFGAVFVLAPRALPVPRAGATPEESELARTLADTASTLEKRMQTVESDEVRERLQRNIQALRASEAELRFKDKMARRAAGEPTATAGAPSAPRSLEEQLQELEQDVNLMNLNGQMAAAGTLAPDLPPEVQRAIEQDMRVLNQLAGAFAAEAERARLEAERRLVARLNQPPNGAMGVMAASPDAAREAVPPATLPNDQLPAAPPWRSWLEPAEDSTPDPGGVIKQVCAAVVNTLEAHGRRLNALGPDEVIEVAVDFVPATAALRTRPARTLLVRARKADVDERAAGRLTGDEFRKRVEVEEY